MAQVPDADCTERRLAAIEVRILIQRLRDRVLPALEAGDHDTAARYHALCVAQLGTIGSQLRALQSSVGELAPSPIVGPSVAITRATDGRRELVDIRRIVSWGPVPLEVLRHPHVDPSSETRLQLRDPSGVSTWAYAREDSETLARRIAEAEQLAEELDQVADGGPWEAA